MSHFRFLIKKFTDYEIPFKVVERLLFLDQLFIRTLIIFIASWTLTWAGVYPVSLLYNLVMPRFPIETYMIAEGIVMFIILASLFAIHAITEKNEDNWIF